jgi:hypothetical protein
MPAEIIPVACVPSANALETAEDLVRLRLALMGELEASLDASRKSLLALNLTGIELGTREQVGLLRNLEAVLRRSMAAPGREKQPTEDRTQAWLAYAPELEDETRRCCHRILQAARLQAALLARARAKLRVVANMLAGQSVTYGPLVARDSAPLRAFRGKSGGEI